MNRTPHLFFVILLTIILLFLQGSLTLADSGLATIRQTTPSVESSLEISPIPEIKATVTPVDPDKVKILHGFMGSWLNYRTLPIKGDEVVGQYTGMRLQIDVDKFTVAGMVCQRPDYSINEVTPEEFFQGYARPGDQHEFFDETFTVLETGCENFEPAAVALVNFHSIGFILENELLLFEPDQSVTQNGVSIESDLIVEYSEDPFYEIRAQVPIILGPETSGYNNLVRQVVEEAIEPFTKDLEERDLPDEMASYRSYMWIGYDVAYLSKDLASIRYYVDFYYAGAAHPGHYFRVVNYDLCNEKEIQFDDLFMDNEKALNFLSDYCKKELASMDFMLFEEGLLPKKENFSNWNLTPSGLRFSFDPYMVAPYAAGPQEVFIPFEKLGDYLDPKFPVGAILAH